MRKTTMILAVTIIYTPMSAIGIAGLVIWGHIGFNLNTALMVTLAVINPYLIRRYIRAREKETTTSDR